MRLPPTPHTLPDSRVGAVGRPQQPSFPPPKSAFPASAADGVRQPPMMRDRVSALGRANSPTRIGSMQPVTPPSKPRLSQPEPSQAHYPNANLPPMHLRPPPGIAGRMQQAPLLQHTAEAPPLSAAGPAATMPPVYPPVRIQDLPPGFDVTEHVCMKKSEFNEAWCPTDFACYLCYVVNKINIWLAQQMCVYFCNSVS
jgi:hypothetical protein